MGLIFEFSKNFVWHHRLLIGGIMTQCLSVVNMYISTKFQVNRTKNKKVIADFQKSRKQSQRSPYGN